MARYLYSELASLMDAYQRNVESGNAEWKDSHEARIKALVEEHLPSDGGFDNGTRLEIGLSRPKLKGDCNKLVFHTSFHHMNDAGMYDGWTNHLVTVTPSLAHGFYLRVSGRDRNEIKGFIADAFHQALATELPKIDRDAMAKIIAKHYSAKLRGPVFCFWDTDKKAFCIRGENLPANPSVQGQYPNGWSMLDHITPEEAEIIRMEVK